jgi:hypothetical protein
MKTQRHDNERGVALILTLTILAIILILLMAFVTSMRTERIAARAFADQTRARFMAEGAIDQAIASMQSAMTNISANVSYVTAPGVAYTRNGVGGGGWVPTSLYTTGSSVDLNGSSNTITGIGPGYPINGVPVNVGWQSVISPTPNSQIIGRFAYWVDDESTKVNVNMTAGPATDPTGFTPEAINLAVPQLFGGNANKIISYVTGTRSLDTIESLKLVNGITLATYLKNQFYVTANATSPDLTPWGTKRLNLSQVVATNTPQNAVAVIATALSDPNLKTWFGQTFADKYKDPNGNSLVNQIAANIVDYVGKGNTPTDSGTTPPTYLGLKETPYLNQIRVDNVFTVTPSATPPGGTLTVSTTVYAELWYMYTNSAPWSAPSFTITVSNIPPISLSGPAGPSQPTVTPNSVTITVPAAQAKMLPSDGTVAKTYAVFTKTDPLPPTPIALLDATKQVLAASAGGKVTATFSTPAGRIDYAEIAVPPTKTKFTVVSGTPITLESFQCNDPRVKPVSGTWNWQTMVPANLGKAPNTLDMHSGNGTLQGDGYFAGNTDISCHNVSANWPNSGTIGRQRGVMYPSELAYIHTGIPWRTLHLEHQANEPSGTIPDWLMADMFSATDMTNVPGRMNINAQINTGAGVFSQQRIAPLNALLNSSGTLPGSIYSVTLNTPPALPSAFAPSVFTTAGQVCEVQGLADGTGLKSAREATARAILNIITPRSDTFTIWAIAQGIKKVQLTAKNAKVFDPTSDLITGEVKVQAVVQRYEDPSTTPASIRFRTLYYRYIYQ